MNKDTIFIIGRLLASAESYHRAGFQVRHTRHCHDYDGVELERGRDCVRTKSSFYCALFLFFVVLILLWAFVYTFLHTSPFLIPYLSCRPDHRSSGGMEQLEGRREQACIRWM